MRIGFDAKRAFFNNTGLGNYSRSVISGLAEYFPDNQYLLYSPKPKKSKLFYNSSSLNICGPSGFFPNLFPSIWRTCGLAAQLQKDKIDIYHGLSNEIPADIDKTSVPSVVTIADLIFITRPELYKPVDRMIYRKKVEYAVKHSRKIFAISRQTRDDLISILSVPESKIEVVYPGSNKIFWNTIDAVKRVEIIKKYGLPEEFILSVGTIEQRKNVLAIIKAIHEYKLNIPLVVIGRPTPYLEQIKAYIEQNNVPDIFFLHGVPLEDLPAFYQQASLLAYPSFYEGFGIPILEALISKIPVITSRGGCFEEAGGTTSIYIDPQNPAELADAIKKILNNGDLRKEMVDGGFKHAWKFKDEQIAKAYMKVYQTC